MFISREFENEKHVESYETSYDQEFSCINLKSLKIVKHAIAFTKNNSW